MPTTAKAATAPEINSLFILASSSDVESAENVGRCRMFPARQPRLGPNHRPFPASIILLAVVVAQDANEVGHAALVALLRGASRRRCGAGFAGITGEPHDPLENVWQPHGDALLIEQ